ncbi:hypothetical protein [Nocardia sp. NPDC057668]|uniref:hypothetical protein n=1 Tax=Nocardia sp. NPDC057668 TaxID=3346202 RepID=UPI00366EB2EB
MFVDERSKSDADAERANKTASAISTAVREDVTARIRAEGVQVDHRNDQVDFAVKSLAGTVWMVARGSRTGELPAQRRDYTDKRGRLAQLLAEQGVGDSARGEIFAFVDAHARTAGTTGKAAIEREDQWKAKTDNIVAARDDQLAQRQAVAAGHASNAERACAARPEPATGQDTPAPTQSSSRHRLHQPEHGR